MTDNQRKLAAKNFAATWLGHGDEKQDTQAFWTSLLRDVYGIERPEEFVNFEVRVQLSHMSYIDALIPSTRVLIEQKGKDINLKKGSLQSDGSMLTPFQQARRYAGYLPHNENPRWIVVCNFQTFEIHDMNLPNSDPEIVKLEDLEQEFHRMNFLTNEKDEHIRKEMKISMQAGEFVGKLYDLLLKQYNDPASEEELRSLNMLCVRLVFCLYAEDAGIFGKHSMFHDYLQGFQPRNVRKALIDLFKVLDTELKDRDPYMDEDLAAFPYVNGGLFRDENIIIPRFTDEIIELLLHNASEEFDWSEISPTIFGAVFESTLNPETRRKGGMHYTSIENIHKVIDPLFLNALESEFDTISTDPVIRTRKRKLEVFQNKLSSLRFLDPACGSGNFLTETYLSLRRLENKIIAQLIDFQKDATSGQIAIGDENINYISISIEQFSGIEINDFAVTVAKTALWIAESQMMKETEAIIHMNLEFLPLTSYANIIEGNALQIDWENVVPKHQLSFIMGNPPFLGARLMSQAQKEDVNQVFGKKWKNTGNLDYVCCWYKKAADMMQGTTIRSALVSTNSVCQGEIVATLWKPLFADGIHFDYAHRTFRWDSEATNKAHVHCVIVGFSKAINTDPRRIFTDNRPQVVSNINGYLLDAANVFIESRKKPLCKVAEMQFGSMPNDGGYLSDFSDEEKNEIVKKYPLSESCFRPLLGATEFINSKSRWCLWLKDVSPEIIRKVPPIAEAIGNVRELRERSNREATKKLAAFPSLFGEVRQPEHGNYLLVPRVSSENRKYVPIGFLNSHVIASDSALIVANASLYHFGIMTSNIHMAWMRAVCGRLKSDYRYSVNIVYNNFPWPTPTAEQKIKIEQTSQAILDARANHPECTMATLYDEAAMPSDLRTAHQKNDRAVMEAYGFWRKLNSETDCVAELMKMYQELTK